MWDTHLLTAHIDGYDTAAYPVPGLQHHEIRATIFHQMFRSRQSSHTSANNNDFDVLRLLLAIVIAHPELGAAVGLGGNTARRSMCNGFARMHFRIGFFVGSQSQIRIGLSTGVPCTSPRGCETFLSQALPAAMTRASIASLISRPGGGMRAGKACSIVPDVVAKKRMVVKVVVKISCSRLAIFKTKQLV